MGAFDKFDDSFNMLIGISNTDIDLFDNPFISINVYELTETWYPKLSDKIKIKKCTYQDKIKFMSKTTASYYPNSLCFEDKSQIHLHHNWFDETFENIFLSIDACNQKTYGKKCAELSEIEEFLSSNIFYFFN